MNYVGLKKIAKSSATTNTTKETIKETATTICTVLNFIVYEGVAHAADRFEVNKIFRYIFLQYCDI